PTWVSHEVAKQLGAKVAADKRPIDIYSHFGLFDFALLLPHTEVYQALFFSEAVIRNITTSTFEEAGVAANVLFCCGVAGLPANGKTMEDLLNAARFAKDTASKAGMPVVTAPPGPPTEESRPQQGEGRQLFTTRLIQPDVAEPTGNGEKPAPAA